jgi:UDP-GlcNAc:undecaprenyl-phosphate GlcNAc-1-phosphate transferase
MDQEVPIKIFSVIVAFVVTVVVIKLLHPLAFRFGWVDKPDARKLHDGATPLTGGVAMLCGIVAAILVSGTFSVRYPMVSAMAALCFLGAIDDVRHIPAWLRLILQTAFVTFVCEWRGLYLANLGDLFGTGFPVVLSHGVGLFLQVFCIIGIINAINMIDGVDGLSGGMLVVALLGLMLLISHTSGPLLMPPVFAAAIGGYLCFNMRGPLRKKAAVFMGDSGSTMMGFAVTWLVASYNYHHVAEGFSPAVCLWLFAIPVFDTASLIFSRGMRGQSPFKADRDHVHHILMRAGLSDRQVTIVLVLAAGILAATGIGGWMLHAPDCVLFYGFLLLFAIYFYCVHHKCQVIKLFQRFGKFRHMVPEAIDCPPTSEM